jgi:hypothetical protein
MRAVVIRPDILIDCDESSLYKARVFQVGTGFGILGDRKKKVIHLVVGKEFHNIVEVSPTYRVKDTLLYLLSFPLKAYEILQSRSKWLGLCTSFWGSFFCMKQPATKHACPTISRNPSVTIVVVVVNHRCWCR